MASLLGHGFNHKSGLSSVSSPIRVASSLMASQPHTATSMQHKAHASLFSTGNPTTEASLAAAAANVAEPKTTGEHMTGTSIMAVEFKGGVVIGADSRTSTGEYVANRVSDKLTRIHERIYMARSGSAADTQAIGDIVAYYIDNQAIEASVEFPEVRIAAACFQDLIYTNKDRLLASIICAGWDKRDGGSVYTVTLGGSAVRQPFAIGGSGSSYIYGLCDAEFKRGMTKDQCKAFVTRGLSHAMARDGSSGGVIRLVCIDETGVTRDMIAGNRLPFMPEQMIG